jgi:CBS domain containing-hemolysin-like protein
MLYLTGTMSDIQPKTVPATELKPATKQSGEASDAPTRSPRPEQERRSVLSWLAARFRGKSASDLRDDLADVLADESETGISGFSAGEREMLSNILGFREVRVEDVMIPRADVLGVDIETTLAELLELFESSGHSRMPVYSGDLDDPKGMVHIRDVLGWITRSARTRKLAKPRAGAGRKLPEAVPLDLSRVDLGKTIGDLKLLRDVLFVPHSMLAGELMQRMRASRTQMALVIDEYGGTDGLVSLEDVVELVVGDIEDEHDDEAIPIAEQSPGVFVVDGGASLEEVTQALGPDFVVGKDGDDVDTIAGLIIAVLGHHPLKGETCVAVPGFEFKVMESGNRRIHKVQITRISE